MKNDIQFISVELPFQIQKEELEREFSGLLLTKIENSFVAEITNDKYIFISNFGVLTFCNFAHDEIKSLLERLGVKEANHFTTALLNQDYPMTIDASCLEPKIDSHTITYNKFNKSIASIISLALSQSVGLEKREKSLEAKMHQAQKLYNTIEHLKIKDRRHLMEFASSIAKERFDILNQLYLLDKPDIAWDDSELESLYNQLSLQLELKNRFEVIEYKIANLKESVELAVDLVNQKSSEFLEWIIIWLIVIEVGFGIYEHIILRHL